MLKILNYKHLLFFLIISLQMVIYNYPYIAKIEPRNVHAWRQYDCLSFAQSFYNNRGKLINPCLNNLGSLQNGNAASEFPIIPFIVGNIWKITGVNSFIYKLVNILFIFFGLFYIYKLFFFEYKNKIFAALIAGLIFSSANLAYYGVSTISDIQSFSLAIAGFYFFYKWIRVKSNLDFTFFIFLFSFACIIKASALFIFSLCLLYLLIEIVSDRTILESRVRKKNLLLFSLLFVPLVLSFFWYSHANSYNRANNNGFFLVGLLPIWDLQIENIYINLRLFIYNLLPQLFSPFILFSVFVFIISNAFFNLKKYLSYSLMLIACLIVFILFVILFFGAMDVHDYYLINMTAVFTISLFFIFKIVYEKLFISSGRLVIFVLFFVMCFNTYMSGIKTWKKINFNVTNFENSLVFNSYEQKEFWWIYWLDRKMYKIFEGNKLDIEKLGIRKTDTILCLGDRTINRSLFSLNRVGYTSFNIGNQRPVNFVNNFKSIKYIFVIDPGMRVDTNVIPLLRNKIFEQDSLAIYKVIR